MLLRLASQSLRCSVGRGPAIYRYSVSRIVLSSADKPPAPVSIPLPPSNDEKATVDAQSGRELLYEKKNYFFHHMMFAVTGINCMVSRSACASPFPSTLHSFISFAFPSLLFLHF